MTKQAKNKNLSFKQALELLICHNPSFQLATKAKVRKCRNLSLGLATKIKAYKGASQK